MQRIETQFRNGNLSFYDGRTDFKTDASDLPKSPKIIHKRKESVLVKDIKKTRHRRGNIIYKYVIL